MKFCQHCGKEIMDEAVVCPGCGCATKQEIKTQAPEVDNTVSGGLVILSILLPIFGIIYWPVKAKTRPKCALTCGITAIVSWVVYIIFMASIGAL